MLFDVASAQVHSIVVRSCLEPTPTSVNAVRRASCASLVKSLAPWSTGFWDEETADSYQRRRRVDASPQRGFPEIHGSARARSAHRLDHMECPELPGAISQGKTRQSALKNAREAILAVLEAQAKVRERADR
jgi:hypothetical protein